MDFNLLGVLNMGWKSDYVDIYRLSLKDGVKVFPWEDFWSHFLGDGSGGRGIDF